MFFFTLALQNARTTNTFCIYRLFCVEDYRLQEVAHNNKRNILVRYLLLYVFEMNHALTCVYRCNVLYFLRGALAIEYIHLFLP